MGYFQVDSRAAVAVTKDSEQKQERTIYDEKNRPLYVVDENDDLIMFYVYQDLMKYPE